MEKASRTTWIEIAGEEAPQIAEQLGAGVAGLVAQGVMPHDEQSRVARLSTALTSDSFVASPERLELLRGLCQIYSAGIRAEKISSHRKFIGPLIVHAKKVVFRVISVLLGPTFSFQRDFNAGVIRLLGSLCNEAEKASSQKSNVCGGDR
jgi:hypothetical protein